MNSRTFLLAVAFIALLIATLTAMLLFGQPDETQNVIDAATLGRATDTAALSQLRDVDREPLPAGEPKSRLLDSGGREDGSRRESDTSEDSISASSDNPETLRELPRGRSRIVFVVEDASGRPQPGIRLQLHSLKPEGGARRLVTGAGGEAVFRDLAAGPYRYLAEQPNGARRISDSLRLEAGEQKKLTLRQPGSDLSITGRVRDQQGMPIAGIVVSIEPHRFASAVSEAGTRKQSRQDARSDARGEFAFGQLKQGEYRVATSATGQYLSASTVVQAGAVSVDLILAEGLNVAGTVTDSSGEPIDRVWVGLDARRDRSALTDADGHYVLQLDAAHVGPESKVRFFLRGYEVALLALPTAGDQGVELDAELSRIENAASITGIVESEQGQPIAGATIVLRSQTIGTQYQAVTDRNGEFSISDAKAGEGYSLRVLPKGLYLDYSRSQIDIPEDGLSFEILLKALETGRLAGRMIDEEGSPVVGFRLWVAASGAIQGAVPISSDQQGYFELAEAPAGSLSFDTRSSPRLAIRGVDLQAGGDQDVVLVLDSGEEELSGKVRGERGDPIAGAELSLSWAHASGNVLSTSRRTTTTHPDGSFRFQQLGPGQHRLEVRAHGHRSIEERYDIGGYAAEVEIRLERDAQ
jgi:protocatechuate 3,4-dioxygenase beta subunit